jgi:histone-lysine N-methyltransferase SETD3
MTSIKIIPKGTQIYDSYGRKCNHRFFVNYGFSLEENDDNESVFIVQVNPEDPQVRMKANLLHAAGLGLVKEFQIPANTKHAKTKACLAFLRLAMSSGSEMILLPSGEELKKRIEASEDDAGLDIIQPLSATNEKAVLKAMKAAAQACLARFETTIEVSLARLLIFSHLALRKITSFWQKGI